MPYNEREMIPNLQSKCQLYWHLWNPDFNYKTQTYDMPKTWRKQDQASGLSKFNAIRKENEAHTTKHNVFKYIYSFLNIYY